jgi:hypothetical protein
LAGQVAFKWEERKACRISDKGDRRNVITRKTKIYVG